MKGYKSRKDRYTVYLYRGSAVARMQGSKQPVPKGWKRRYVIEGSEKDAWKHTHSFPKATLLLVDSGGETSYTMGK